MATQIIAPENPAIVNSPTLFLAGGITGCPDWQKDVVSLLKPEPSLTIFNPRRPNFPIDDPNAANEQITWEYRWLRDCDLISFWFAEKEIQPITLFEFGRWSADLDKPIFVGVHPKYPRKQDVEIQLELIRPGHKIVHTLDGLAHWIRSWMQDMYEQHSFTMGIKGFKSKVSLR